MSNITVDQPTVLNNGNLNHDSSYKPWTTVIRRRSTCTANIHNIYKELIDNDKPPISRDDIAKALHHKNLLRQTKVI